MWQIKHFSSEAHQSAWIAKNEAKFQVVVLFVNNGYAVQFKKLMHVY